MTSMLNELQWDSLESRRTKNQLTMLYKMTNNLIDIHPVQYLTPGSTRTRSNHSLQYQQISTITNCYKYSFFSRTIPVWNYLPAPAADAPTLLFCYLLLVKYSWFRLKRLYAGHFCHHWLVVFNTALIFLGGEEWHISHE